MSTSTRARRVADLVTSGSGSDSGTQTYNNISQYIPTAIWQNVTAGTNTVDLAGYIQTALNDCAISGKTLVFYPYVYKCNSGISWDYGKHSIIGYGAELNFAGVTTAINCITISTAHVFVNNLWDTASFAMQGLIIRGRAGYGQNTPRVSGMNGIIFGEGEDQSGAHASIQNVSISGFDTGIVFGDHSYVQKIDSCSIHDCNTATKFDGTILVDSGERIGFTNCTLFNSPILVHAVAGNYSFSNCSFDYFTNQAIIAEYGGAVYLTDCHIETREHPNLNPWMECIDSYSRICLTNTHIVVSEAVDVFIGQADTTADQSDTGSADAGIYLVNCLVAFTPTGRYSLATLFKGACYVVNLTDFVGGRYSASNPRIQVYVDRNNLLMDGGFENNTTLKEWTVSSGTGYTAPTRTSADAASGTYSLNMAPTAGNTSKIYKSFNVGPGAKPTLGFKAKGTIPSGSYLNVTVGYANADGYDNKVASRTFSYSYTSSEINTSDWVVETIRPYSRAPLGATRFYVTIEATGSTDVLIDDIIVEILDNKVATVDLNDTSLDKLKDVDIVSTAPTDGQTLVWNAASKVFVPGTVSGGSGSFNTSSNYTVTGTWWFNNSGAGGSRLGNLNFKYADINELYSNSDTANITVNYSSPENSSYFRDFTVYNGKGSAAFRITGSSRTGTFYSKLQTGVFTIGTNLFADTEGASDGTETAFNYYSGFDIIANTWSQPYYRNVNIYDGKGASLLKATGATSTIDFNASNVLLNNNSLKWRSNAVYTNVIASATTTDKTITLPNRSGTVSLDGYDAVALTNLDSFSITNSHSIIIFDTGITLDNIFTLPPAPGNTGKVFKLSNQSGVNIKLTTNGNGNIHYQATRDFGTGRFMHLVSDGTNYLRFAGGTNS